MLPCGAASGPRRGRLHGDLDGPLGLVQGSSTGASEETAAADCEGHVTGTRDADEAARGERQRRHPLQRRIAKLEGSPTRAGSLFFEPHDMN